MATAEFLLDTSCVLASIHPSFPELRRQIDERTSDGTVRTTGYLRMEFYRRWILTWIEVYFAAKRFGDLEQAVTWMSERFGTRDVKAVTHLITLYSQREAQRGVPKGSVIRRLGNLIYQISDEYEARFGKPWENNNCGCRRTQHINREGRSLDEALAAFYKAFKPDVLDCPVNVFLNFASKSPRARPVLDRGADLKVKGSPKTGFSRLVKQFAAYLSDLQHITCRECERIGDVVIAMDMPKSFILLHTDYAFDYLCECLGVTHDRLKTPRATSPEREVLGALRGA